MTLDSGRMVRDVYLALLKREPDNSGMKRFSKVVSKSEGLDEFLSALMSSNEYKNRAFQEIWNSRQGHYRFDKSKLDLPYETLAALCSKTATYWREASSSQNEMYFSVLTNEVTKQGLNAAQREDFFESGMEFVDFAIAKFREHGHKDFSSASVLDFGCGVGRLAIHAAPLFKKMVLADFSKGHMDEALKNLSERTGISSNDLETVVIEQPNPTFSFPAVDFAYSHITLQHNTPPVMAYFISRILDALTPGGIALLHIPVHHPFYDFDATRYLHDQRSGKIMEMHMLPRENLREIALDRGSQLLDSYGFGGTTGVYSEVFAIQKKGAP